ncbi:MAG: hypothetical protein AB7U73_18405 [Pirellulales bacterium]
MAIHLQFEPLIPWPLWLVFTIGGLAALVAYGLRRPWGISPTRWLAILALAAVAIAIPLAILLNPVWIERLPPPAGKPGLTILVDRSESMNTSDAPQERSRYAAALELAEAASENLSSEFETRIVSFADRSNRTTLETLADQHADGPQTDISGALRAIATSGTSDDKAILLLSDGAHNASDDTSGVFEAARLARAMGTRIFTCTLGQGTESKDLEVRLLVPEQVAFVRQRVPITALVRQRGLTVPDVEIVLRRDGQDLSRVRTTFFGDQAAEAHFEVVQDQTGLYRYEVAVEPVPGETTRANNQALMVLRVVDKPIRVLLLEGKPYWDGKFLLRTLALDAALEVDNVVRIGPQRFLKRSLRRAEQAGAPPAEAKAAPAPATGAIDDENGADRQLSESWEIIADPQPVLAEKKALGDYQVVVLGREADIYLSDAAIENIRQWISRQGGALVCYRGQPAAQLSARLRTLMPVEWSPGPEARFRMDLTERGQSLGWLTGDSGARSKLSDLPSLATSARADSPKPLAVVLADSAQADRDVDVPAVSYQGYGTGRVVVIEGVGMWRWAFLAPAFRSHDDTYRALWQSLLRWLVTGPRLLPGQNVAVRTDKLVFAANEDATATMLVREGADFVQPPQVMLTGTGIVGTKPFAPTASDEDGTIFRLNFGKLPEGNYSGAIEGIEGDDGSTRLEFEVRTLLDEQLYLQARPDIMARVAVLSDGAVVGEDGADDVAAIAAAIRERSVDPGAQEVRRHTAWDRWWVLLGAFTVWSALWITRRTAGLV